jgi:capsular polysaccharide export protein
VFAAAYLRYCRYINPYTGERCELEDTLALIADQKRVLERGRGDWTGVGFLRWKRGFVGRFLGAAAQLRHVPDTRQLSGVPVEGGRLLAWASRVDDELIERSAGTGQPLWRIEDGFVRSVGLGADLVDPLSLVLDSRGIYYDASRPSDLEVLLETAELPDDLIGRAIRLRQRLVALKLSKYNVGHSQRLDLPAGRRIALVPGQVETDASIRCGSPELKTNAQLLTAVRAANPDAFIVYKPHPDVLAGGRQGSLGGDAPLFDLEVRDLAMPELLEQVDEVHTLTSLTGFEALLRGLTVVTYGLPFYAGWGLTQDRLRCARRTRVRSLDELVAATLMLYPVYVDPHSGDTVNAETAVELLVRTLQRGYRRSWKGRLYNMIRRPC